MMNGVIIHHCRAAALILWLSLVALCDPYPSSRGGTNHSTQNNLDTHSNGPPLNLSNPRQNPLISEPTTSIPSTSASPQVPFDIQIFKNISKLPSFLSKLSLHSTKPVLPNNSPTNNIHNITKKSTIVVRSNAYSESESVGTTPTNLSSFRDGIEGLVEEKGEPVMLLSQLNSDSVEKSPLVLRLDRDYTPTEIAEYIVSTNDEKGFSQVVAEMIQDGEIVDSKDVILFLEAVQEQLDRIRKLNHQQPSIAE